MFDCQRIACCAYWNVCAFFNLSTSKSNLILHDSIYTLHAIQLQRICFFFKLKRYIFSKKTEIPAIQFNMTMFHTICNDSGTRVVTLKSACNAIEKWISVCSIWLMAQILWYCKLAHSIVNMTMLMTFQQVKKNN